MGGAGLAGNRGDVDDAPDAAGGHQPPHGLAEQEVRPKVDLLGAVPVLDVCVEECRAAPDARDVDQAVEVVERAVGGGHDIGHRARFARVVTDRDMAGTEITRDTGNRVDLNVGQCQPHPLVSQALRHRTADSLRRARHQRCPVPQAVHVPAPSAAPRRPVTAAVNRAASAPSMTRWS